MFNRDCADSSTKFKQYDVGYLLKDCLPDEEITWCGILVSTTLTFQIRSCTGYMVYRPGQTP